MNKAVAGQPKPSIEVNERSALARSRSYVVEQLLQDHRREAMDGPSLSPSAQVRNIPELTDPLCDVGQVASMLRKSRGTVLNDRGRNPHALPPAVRIPGTSSPMWRRSDIEKWIAELPLEGRELDHVHGVQVSASRLRRSRPNKTRDRN